MPHTRFQTTRTDIILDSDDPDSLALEVPISLASYQVGGRTFIYQANRISDEIGIFEVMGDGSIVQLAPNAGTSNTDAGYTVAVTVINDVAYLYHQGANLDVFRIADTGFLTLVQSVAAPEVISNTQITPSFVTINGTTYMVAMSFGGDIVTYEMNSDGTLGTLTDSLTVDSAALGLSNNFLSASTTVVVDGSTYVYARTFSEGVVVLDMASDGTLANERLVATFSDPPRGGFEVAETDGGRYLVFSTFGGDFLSYAISDDGSLTLADMLPYSSVYSSGFSVNTFDLIQTDDGRSLFLASQNGGGYALIEILSDGSFDVIELIATTEGSIDDDWRTTTSFLIDGTIFTVAGGFGVEGLGVYKTTTGADVAARAGGSSVEGGVITVGAYFKVTTILENIGDIAASGSYMSFSISDDAVLDESDTFIAFGPQPDLDIGEEVPVSVDFLPRFMPEDLALGQYYMIVRADNDDQIDENDENNNTVALRFEYALFTQGDDDITLTKSTAYFAHRMFAGNDKATGTTLSDNIAGGSGSDTIQGLRGDDQLSGDIGKDTLFGGSGGDNLYGGGSNDRLNGGDGADYIEGGVGNDLLIGGNSDDVLVGGSGKDSLSGGGGNDIIYGNSQADRQSGGSGADMFVFRAVSDSRAGAQNRDVITDFQPGKDSINLASIDANENKAWDQNFTYRGTAGFTGSDKQGEVNWAKVSSGVLVRIDADADGDTDMQILLTGISRLSVDDFIL